MRGQTCHKYVLPLMSSGVKICSFSPYSLLLKNKNSYEIKQDIIPYPRDVLLLRHGFC